MQVKKKRTVGKGLAMFHIQFTCQRHLIFRLVAVMGQLIYACTHLINAWMSVSICLCGNGLERSSTVILANLHKHLLFASTHLMFMYLKTLVSTIAILR